MSVDFDSHGYPKLYKHPRYLFRYVRTDKRLISALEERFLWYSNPQNLNDPFDCQWLLESENTASEIFQFLSQFGRGAGFNRQQRKRRSLELAKDKNALAAISNNGFDEFASKLGICCFSECGDHPLMWAHYANGHRGACLVFEFKKMQSEKIGVPMRVAYLSSPPKFNLIRDRIRNGSTPAFNNNFQQAVLATKSIDWAYEKEIRFISNWHGKIGFDPLALVGIIFGGKLDKDSRNEIAAAALRINEQIQFSEAKIDARNGCIIVDGFVNQTEEGEVLKFLERDGHLDARSSFSIVKYSDTQDK